jgi:hypothetical protein
MTVQGANKVVVIVSIRKIFSRHGGTKKSIVGGPHISRDRQQTNFGTSKRVRHGRKPESQRVSWDSGSRHPFVSAETEQTREELLRDKPRYCWGTAVCSECGSLGQGWKLGGDDVCLV